MIDQQEKRYRKLRRLGQELHVPIPETFIKLEVRDRDGRLLERQYLRSHSFDRNVYNYIFSHLAARNCPDSLFGAGYMSMKATSGTIRHGNSGAGIIAQINFEGNGPNAGAGVDDRGILVGSGTDAESFEDYFLQSQIANGTGAGQLSHVASEAPVYSYNAGNKTWAAELKRYFNNNSGGGIGVNELALVYYLERVVGTADKLLWSRDKLPSTVTVPNTGQLRVTYNIRLAYPA